jgi:hypothetical protein
MRKLKCDDFSDNKDTKDCVFKLGKLLNGKLMLLGLYNPDRLKMPTNEYKSYMFYTYDEVLKLNNFLIRYNDRTSSSYKSPHTFVNRINQKRQ